MSLELTEKAIACLTHDEKNIKGFFGEYRWLSNFYKCIVAFDSKFYPSSENGYQAAKTLDHELREHFQEITPFQSKKESHKLNIRENWDEIRYDIMSSLVFDKFYRNQELREKLLATGDKYLEETNYWDDTYWGVCNGVGENNLGKILMKVRDYWREK